MRRVRTALTATVLTAAMLLSACTAADPRGATPEREPARASGGDAPAFVLPDELELAASLSAFDACDDYLSHVKAAALEQVTPWGLGGGRHGVMEFEEDGSAEMDDAAPADERAGGVQDGAAPTAPVEGEDFSGTNVQEAGVDEPDRAKTDGERLYVITESHLRILDITGDDPVELGSLPVREAYDAQLLLDGDRLLMTSSVHGAVPFAGERLSDSMPHHSGVTTITLIDVGDPTDPQVEERLTLDGATLSSRLVGGVARIVVRTEQGVDLPWVYPEGSGLRAERRALEANQELIRTSEAEDWIPYFVHETAEGSTTERSLLACDRIARPQEFAGLGVLSILTVDVAGGGLLPGDEAIGVLAGGDTVYASTDRLYVATTRWVDWESMNDRARRQEAERTVTEVHGFAIDDPSTTTYLASGEVPGTLLSQWAMSEHEGRLRVASTIGDMWWGPGWGSDGPSESVVTVLEQQGAELTVIGQVDGLGVTERIYAVRFMGDVGYVVTFRETDPLYTLDLADPTDPRVTGELKITGYSAYLHPMGDDLLLGVGQDADERGMTKGTQLSLFDVADPADPQRIDQVTLADGSSDVEYDHRAFLHWPATGLTVVPYQRWSHDERTGKEDVDSGALAFTVSRNEGIERAGELSHLPQLRGETFGDDPEDRALLEDVDAAQQWVWDWGWQGAITRSMVRGDRLLTLSQAGVATHDLDTLEDTGWHRFDR
jgi:uncharacterized secreted protein with C-terminal beta-propeller domain